jgi:hypothetical protein
MSKYSDPETVPGSGGNSTVGRLEIDTGAVASGSLKVVVDCSTEVRLAVVGDPGFVETVVDAVLEHATKPSAITNAALALVACTFN